MFYIMWSEIKHLSDIFFNQIKVEQKAHMHAAQPERQWNTVSLKVIPLVVSVSLIQSSEILIRDQHTAHVPHQLAAQHEMESSVRCLSLSLSSTCLLTCFHPEIGDASPGGCNIQPAAVLGIFWIKLVCCWETQTHREWEIEILLFFSQQFFFPRTICAHRCVKHTLSYLE